MAKKREIPKKKKETVRKVEKKTVVPTAWMRHVKAYKQANPGTSHKNALKLAKETYTKIKREPREKKENPWMKHITEWKAANPRWKETMKYKEVLLKCKDSYRPATVVF